MNILVLCGAGIGGTEKAAFLFAEELILRGHKVVAVSDPDHPRTAAFQQVGGLVIPGECDRGLLSEIIREHSIQVIHQHVSGYSDQREVYEALDSFGSECPRLIETNVFGQLLDPHDQGRVDFRMFITFTSGMQAFQRTRMVGSRIDPLKCGVVFYPVQEGEFSPDESRRSAVRESLGVKENEFLVIRIGRPGHKWTTWECEAFVKAREKNQALRMLLMEPNPSIVAGVNAGKYGGGIIVKEATSDTAYLSDIYRAADLMLHASNHGESYGYTVAEAMQAGLPVITRATPWGDNAQTELVTHGKTGYVCGSVRGLANSLVELSLDRELSAAFGRQGAASISRTSSLKHETDLLEDVIEGLFEGKPWESTRQRFQAWIAFIKARNGSGTPCYERDRKDLLGVAKTEAYRIFRELKTLKKFYKQRFVRHRQVLFPRRKAIVPASSGEAGP